MFDWILGPGLKIVGKVMVGGGISIAAVGAVIWYLFKDAGGM